MEHVPLLLVNNEKLRTKETSRLIGAWRPLCVAYIERIAKITRTDLVGRRWPKMWRSMKRNSRINMRGSWRNFHKSETGLAWKLGNMTYWWNLKGKLEKILEASFFQWSFYTIKEPFVLSKLIFEEIIPIWSNLLSRLLQFFFFDINVRFVEKRLHIPFWKFSLIVSLWFTVSLCIEEKIKSTMEYYLLIFCFAQRMRVLWKGRIRVAITRLICGRWNKRNTFLSNEKWTVASRETF